VALACLLDLLPQGASSSPTEARALWEQMAAGVRALRHNDSLLFVRCDAELQLALAAMRELLAAVRALGQGSTWPALCAPLTRLVFTASNLSGGVAHLSTPCIRVTERCLLRGARGQRPWAPGVAELVAPFLRLAAGGEGVAPAWSAELGFRVLAAGSAPLPKGANLARAVCGRLEARCGRIEFSEWDAGRRLLGAISLLNGGCAQHANVSFKCASGASAVRAEATAAIPARTELLARYGGSRLTCAAPGCATSLRAWAAPKGDKC
jgi:hypothetical protein